MSNRIVRCALLLSVAFLVLASAQSATAQTPALELSDYVLPAGKISVVAGLITAGSSTGTNVEVIYRTLGRGFQVGSVTSGSDMTIQSGMHIEQIQRNTIGLTERQLRFFDNSDPSIATVLAALNNPTVVLQTTTTNAVEIPLDEATTQAGGNYFTIRHLETDYAAANVILQGIGTGDKFIFAIRTDIAAPTVPTGLSTTAKTTTAVTVDWNDVTAATGYEYQYKLASDSTWTGPTAVTASTVTLTGLSSAVYDFQVKATSAGGASAFTATFKVVPTLVTTIGLTLSPVSPVAFGTSVTVTVVMTNPLAGDHTGSISVQESGKTTVVATCAENVALTFGVAATSTLSATATILATCPVGTYDVVTDIEHDSSGAVYPVGTTPLVVSTAVEPPAPSGLQSSAVTSTGLTLAWTAVSDTTGYAYKKKLSTESVFDAEVSVTTASAVITGLLPNQEYDFQVKSVNFSLSSAFSASYSATTAPGAPSGLPTTNPKIDAITVGYVGAAGATTVEFQHKKNSAVDWETAVTKNAGQTHTYTGLDSGTAYNFRARGISTNGTGDWSAAKTSYTLPKTPSNLTLSSATSTSLTFDWDDVVGANEYAYYYKQKGTLTWSGISYTNTSTATVASLGSSTTYDFHVWAKGNAGNSPFVAASTGTTNIGMVANLSASSATGTTVTLDWDDTKGATGYEYQFRQDGVESWGVNKLVTSSTVVITGLSSGIIYDVRVKAKKEGDTDGDWSATVSKITVPAVPTGVTQAAATTSSVTLGWSEQTGADDYDWQYRASSTTTWSTAETVTDNSAEVTSLAIGTTYEFRVLASNSSGDSAYSAEIDALTLPDIPANVAVGTSTTSTLPVSWDSATGATAYVYQYRVKATATWSEETEISALTVTLGSLDANTTYQFRVKARNSGGDGEYTAAVEGMTVLAAPKAPVGLQVVSTTVTSALLDWDDTNGAESYKYQYKTAAAAAWSAAVGVTASTVSVGFLSSGTEYQFKVLATNSAGDSSYGSVVKGYTNPSAPSGMIAISSAPDKLQFSWSAVTGASTYVYQHKLKTSPDTAWSLETTTTSVSVTIASLEGATAYDFRVKVRGQGGDSAWSVISSTTQVPIPLTPSGLVSTAVTSTSVTIDWNDVAHATSYNYQYRLTGQGWPSNGTSVDASVVIVTGLVANTSFDFRVQAVNASGSNAYTSGLTKLTLLTTPTALQATGRTSTSVTLDWDDVQGALTYQYQYRQGASGNWSASASASSSSATVSSLTTGTVHQFRVRAVNSNVNSEWTQALSDATILDTPTGLRVSGQTATTVTIDWSDVSGATSYQYRYRVKDTGEWRFTDSIATSTATIRGLTRGVTYEVQVRASNRLGHTAWTTSRDFITAVAEPDGVRLSTRELNSLTWAWNVVNGADRYYWQQRRESSSSWGSTTAYVTQNHVGTTNLAPNTTYRFRVRSWTQQSGFSGYSQEVTATTKPPAPFSRTASQDFDMSDLLNHYVIPDARKSSASTYTRTTIWGAYRTNSDLWVGYSYRVRRADDRADVTKYEIIPVDVVNYGFDPNRKISLHADNITPSGLVVDGNYIYVVNAKSNKKRVFAYSLNTLQYNSGQSWDYTGNVGIDIADDADNFYLLSQGTAGNYSVVAVIAAWDKTNRAYQSGDSISFTGTSSTQGTGIITKTTRVNVLVSDGSGNFFVGFSYSWEKYQASYPYTRSTGSSTYLRKSVSGSFSPPAISSGSGSIHIDYDPSHPTATYLNSSDREETRVNIKSLNALGWYAQPAIDDDLSFSVIPRNMAPTGIHADADTIWVADAVAYRVFAYDLQTKEYVGSKDQLLPRSTEVGAIWMDDNNLWLVQTNLANSIGTNSLVGFTRATHKQIDIDGDGDHNNDDIIRLSAVVGDIWGKEQTIWVVYPTPPSNSPAIRAYDLSSTDRVELDEWSVESLTAQGIEAPSGIWSNGIYWWISDTDDDQLFAFGFADKVRNTSKDFKVLRAAKNNLPTYLAGTPRIMFVSDDKSALHNKYVFAYNHEFTAAPGFFTSIVPNLQFTIQQASNLIQVRWNSIGQANGYDVVVNNSLPVTMLDATVGSVQSYVINYDPTAELASVAVRGRVCAEDDQSLSIRLDDQTIAEIPQGQCSYTPYSDTLVVRIAATTDLVRDVPEGITEAVAADNRVALAIGELLELGGAVENAESYSTRTWLPPIAFFIAISTAGMLIWLTGGGAGITPAGVFIGAMAFAIIFGIIGPLMMDVPIAMAAAAFLLPLVGLIFILKTRT